MFEIKCRAPFRLLHATVRSMNGDERSMAKSAALHRRLRRPPLPAVRNTSHAMHDTNHACCASMSAFLFSLPSLVDDKCLLVGLY